MVDRDDGGDRPSRGDATDIASRGRRPVGTDARCDAARRARPPASPCAAVERRPRGGRMRRAGEARSQLRAARRLPCDAGLFGAKAHVARSTRAGCTGSHPPYAARQGLRALAPDRRGGLRSGRCIGDLADGYGRRPLVGRNRKRVRYCKRCAAAARREQRRVRLVTARARCALGIARRATGRRWCRRQHVRWRRRRCDRAGRRVHQSRYVGRLLRRERALRTCFIGRHAHASARGELTLLPAGGRSFGRELAQLACRCPRHRQHRAFRSRDRGGFAPA